MAWVNERLNGALHQFLLISSMGMSLNAGIMYLLCKARQE
jgi:hypothetical protein